MSATSPSGPLNQLRILGLSLTTGPVIVVVALAFVLPLDTDDVPPVPVVLGLLAVAVLGVVLAERLGFRVPALTPAEAPDAAEISLERYRVASMIRFAVVEAPILVGIVASFVLDFGLWPLLVIAVVSVPAMAWEVLPTRRTIERTKAALESGGVMSRLDEVLV
ncbi:hypothetical protein ASD11_11705 [Aeromicrobium sp. Root495]|uniref:hypothetical protein n=1 Tax=Aeromicrobium sp. Root495 TaxID=1736550 RepID=UPI0007010DBD|nr:hypothetical protein [Aeromicrobium sp. Root495]KQY60145.1 hypothetical protein ASD11_11705 [Aeromicrobium sp. Root495]RYJ04890.1 MAG: hypothetical protein EON52_14430 [Actinomycetales bacterium]